MPKATADVGAQRGSGLWGVPCFFAEYRWNGSWAEGAGCVDFTHPASTSRNGPPGGD